MPRRIPPRRRRPGVRPKARLLDDIFKQKSQRRRERETRDLVEQLARRGN